MTHVPQPSLVVKSMSTPVVTDFAKIRDQKDRGMLKTGAKEKCDVAVERPAGTAPLPRHKLGADT